MILLLAAILGCSCVSNIEDQECNNTQNFLACDFQLEDQHGNTFRLYEQLGTPVVLDFSAMWCGPCQQAASEVQQVQNHYGKDLVYATILVEDLTAEPPSAADLDLWATVFDIKAPVLAGNRIMLGTTPTQWPLTSWPTFYLLDEDLTIRTSIIGFAPGSIEQAIEGL